MYLVTGGAGFIGSNICQTLLAKGESVRVLDNFSSGKLENLAPFASDIDLINGDLRNLDTLKKAAKGVQFVLHQGATTSVPQSVKDPLGTNENNITGTLNVLTAAKQAGVERVVFASSCSVYGDDPRLPKREDHSPKPMTPYALQKLTGEFYCRQFTDLYGFEAVALRYFNVFGQLQNPKSLYSAVIPKFCDSIFSGGAPTIFGDGEQTRDFIFIEDVVAANLAAATHPNAAGNVFNIASGQRLSLNDLILQLGKVLGKKIEAKYEPKRDGDIRHSVADISFAKQHLGFQSQTSFLDGLKKYVNWFEQQR